MTVQRETGCGCPAGGPCGEACTCKPAREDAPPSCVCKLPKAESCDCPAGGPCKPNCTCSEDACLCKAPREALAAAS